MGIDSPDELELQRVRTGGSPVFDGQEELLAVASEVQIAVTEGMQVA
jgi:hypothetical protein